MGAAEEPFRAIYFFSDLSVNNTNWSSGLTLFSRPSLSLPCKCVIKERSETGRRLLARKGSRDALIIVCPERAVPTLLSRLSPLCLYPINLSHSRETRVCGEDCVVRTFPEHIYDSSLWTN